MGSKTARSVADVHRIVREEAIEAQKTSALAQAPTPPLPWQKVWSGAMGMVHFVNSKTNVKVWSIDEVLECIQIARAESDAAAKAQVSKLGSLSIDHWESDGMEDQKRYCIHVGGQEAAPVLDRFHETMARTSFTVVKVERVENFYQHETFAIQVKAISRMHVSFVLRHSIPTYSIVCRGSFTFQIYSLAHAPFQLVNVAQTDGVVLHDGAQAQGKVQPTHDAAASLPRHSRY